jgi:hypothetical protein
MICPACRGSVIYSSHRHGILERRVLTWMGVLPFHCGHCRTRFYKIALKDPRRQRKTRDPVQTTDLPRAPRWITEIAAEVTIQMPGQPSARLKGVAKNASLEGTRLHLLNALPEGSLVSVSLQGGPARLGSVRWSLPDHGSGFLHGIRFQVPLEPHGVLARPLRRLRLRQFLRRGLIVLLGSIVIAVGAYGLDRLIESLRTYRPTYYEPKDVERQVYEDQQLIEQQRQTKQPSDSGR